MNMPTLRSSENLRKYSLLLGFLLLANVPMTAHGQQVVPGDRIRVKSTGSAAHRWTEVTLIRLTADSLWYESNGGVSWLPMANSVIQRPTHQDRRVAGTVIGVIAGGAAGALIAHATFEPEFKHSSIGAALGCALNNCTPPQSNSRGQVTAGGALFGAALGGGLGYLIGKAAGRWETVEIDQIAATNGAFSMSLRVTR